MGGVTSSGSSIGQHQAFDLANVGNLTLQGDVCLVIDGLIDTARYGSGEILPAVAHHLLRQRIGTLTIVKTGGVCARSLSSEP